MKWTIHNADVLVALKEMPDEHYHALISDPPAGISFMAASWDHDKGGRDEWILWLTEVMRECYRVLKPGAHLFVWALPRTSHWTATAIENAGFECRDVITHLFGQGFPKSANISKQIDRSAGIEREVIGIRKHPTLKDTSKIEEQANAAHGSNVWAREWDVTAHGTDSAKTFNGYGTALKPASEHWILARKPLAESTIAANCVKHGAGALNIEAGRISTSEQAKREHKGAVYDGVADGYKRKNKSSYTHKTDWAMQPQGRWPANFCVSHLGPLPNGFGGCECVGEKKVESSQGSEAKESRTNGVFKKGLVARVPSKQPSSETVSAWNCAASCVCGHVWAAEKLGRCPECGSNRTEWACPVARLDAQAGNLKSGHLSPEHDVKPSSGWSGGSQADRVHQEFGANEGGASRYFFNSDWQLEVAERLANADVVRYQAKPGARERSIGCESLPEKECGMMEDDNYPIKTGSGNLRDTKRRNTHPCCKPVSLCKHLATLLLPPKEYAPRRLLNCFTGSGSEMIGALLAGFDEVVGIEKDTEAGYVVIAEARLKFWSEQMQRHGPDVEKILKASVRKKSASQVLTAPEKSVTDSAHKEVGEKLLL